jgi:adenylate kinase family enzyme
MKKLIMIIGEPGSGKSSLVKELLSQQEHKQIKHQLLRAYEIDKDNYKIFVFGIYFSNEIFEGTDKLSMGVQPSAIDFMLNAPTNSIFITEGDRLGNAKLLAFCKENGIQYQLIHLYCEKPHQRRDKRGSKQSETWISSRQTKIRNLLSNHEHIEINNADGKLKTIAQIVLNLCDLKSTT